MRPVCVVVLLLTFAAPTPAQDQTWNIEDAIEAATDWAEDNLDTNIFAAIESRNPVEIQRSIEQWAQNNLDTNAIGVLEKVDQERVIRFLLDLEKRFRNENVAGVARLKVQAADVLPLLKSHEETAPYAAWLKLRMDYLRVADDMCAAAPPPKIEPRPSPWVIPNPDAAHEREIWGKEIARRPLPDGAKNYVSKLKPVFKQQEVPGELVWIAEVESGFDSRARSPSGAVGMFQLMPVAAKRFGLSLFPRDQRLQPEASACASAKYLKNLHDRFKDWRLALAAYNAGEGTVQRQLDRHKVKTFDGIAVHLPAETQMYVPKVEATLLIREGARLGQLE